MSYMSAAVVTRGIMRHLGSNSLIELLAQDQSEATQVLVSILNRDAFCGSRKSSVGGWNSRVGLALAALYWDLSAHSTAQDSVMSPLVTN